MTRPSAPNPTVPPLTRTTSLITCAALALSGLGLSSCSSTEEKPPEIGVAYKAPTQTVVTVVGHEMGVAQGDGRRAGGHIGGAVGGLVGAVGGGFVGSVLGSFFGSEVGRKGLNKKVSQYTIRTDAGQVVTLYQDDLTYPLRVGEKALLLIDHAAGTSRLVRINGGR